MQSFLEVCLLIGSRYRRLTLSSGQELVSCWEVWRLEKKVYRYELSWLRYLLPPFQRLACFLRQADQMFVMLRLLLSVKLISRRLEFVQHHSTKISQIIKPFLQRIVSSYAI